MHQRPLPPALCPVKRRTTMRCVLHNLEMVLLRELPYTLNVPHLAPVVNRNDRNYFLVARKGFRHPALGVCNINIEISFMAIGQNGMCTEITNHLCCCGKGHCRHNDSLPGLET